ncbi:MAG: ribbon-helix-helix protein, CopG family [Thermoplasmata archaeon]|nr:ribbon-helix-helix protein, CopG family [Thermoplasmata archaeon]
MSEVVTMRLPEEISSELNELARVLDRSKTYILRKALEEYLDEYEDYLIAMERWNDKNDEIIDGKELRDSLGL